MSQAETTAVQILKWAVRSGLPAPAFEAMDQDVLIDLTTYHRIEARLLARLASARPAGCPASLLTRLRIRQHQVRLHTEERIDAAREMSHAMRARGLPPPIFVKGFAAYALTANPDGLHYSGDLDPFAGDLPAFWDGLHDLGYIGKRKDTHEWAKLQRDGITLDIHQYFPMLAYPPEVRDLPAERLEARQNLGHWQLPAPASGLVDSAEPIRWGDLSPAAVSGRAPGTEELLFPSPTLLCLIHCAHCFRSSVTRLHYMDPRGGFRLYELLSICELARLPGFDAKQFISLVDRYAAHDSVRLINTLTASFLGARVLPECDPAGEDAETFPEQLIYGGWVSLQRTEDWLWRRGIEQMLDQMDANVISAMATVDAHDIPRLLTYGTPPPLLPQIGLAWEEIKNSLKIQWNLGPVPAVSAEHELLVHFGYGSVVKVHLDKQWGIRAITQKSDYGRMAGQATAEAAFVNGSHSVFITCSVPIWPDAPAAPPTSLSLFLAVRRLGADGETTEAAMYLPLRLTA